MAKKNDWGFDLLKLRTICNMEIDEFMDGRYGEVVDNLDSKNKLSHDGRYSFKDNGTNILAVAHVDTVVFSEMFTWNGSRRIGSGQFDDRLGVYVITELLPSLGLNYDILLCTDEEAGASTAEYFDAPEGKQYNWIFEFDRMGDDVVLYQYWGDEWEAALKDVGFEIGHGSYSDISRLAHLDAKAVNLGVSYKDYHSYSSTADLIMLRSQINRFIKFYHKYKDTRFEHDYKQERYPAGKYKTWTSYGSGSWKEGWDDDYEYTYGGYGGYTSNEKMRLKGALHTPEDGDTDDYRYVYTKDKKRRWNTSSGEEDVEYFKNQWQGYLHTNMSKLDHEQIVEFDGKYYFMDTRTHVPKVPLDLWEYYMDDEIYAQWGEYADWTEKIDRVSSQGKKRGKGVKVGDTIIDADYAEELEERGYCPECGRDDCYGVGECQSCFGWVHDDEFLSATGCCIACARAYGLDWADIEEIKDNNRGVDERWDY